MLVVQESVETLGPVTIKRAGGQFNVHSPNGGDVGVGTMILGGGLTRERGATANFSATNY
jgi:hypothetical protein